MKNVSPNENDDDIMKAPQEMEYNVDKVYMFKGLPMIKVLFDTPNDVKRAIQEKENNKSEDCYNKKKPITYICILCSRYHACDSIFIKHKNKELKDSDHQAQGKDLDVSAIITITSTDKTNRSDEVSQLRAEIAKLCATVEGLSAIVQSLKQLIRYQEEEDNNHSKQENSFLEYGQ
ncbi:hypothetical protein RFI_00430 [Reticulomyxa filosa]|uniref:Uncharacterized protein n=1 Tax=Reticulomyxa filosa TaxID=46433 RepID=X6PG08_RETFI|nr:hypothetical protein RFI_00430 [Reticulomyxa filosa]|eukprot:ETO36632.1 hypothetical protein RFI_00430 [Reticulomyxa filosa]